MDQWSDFQKDAERHSPVRGPKCGVSRMLEGMPPEGVAAFNQALDNKGLSVRAIRNALIHRLGEDNVPSGFSIAHHRRRDCRCWKPAADTTRAAA